MTLSDCDTVHIRVQVQDVECMYSDRIVWGVFGASEERASMECAQSQAEYFCRLIEALANLIRALSGVKRCHKWNLIN